MPASLVRARDAVRRVVHAGPDARPSTADRILTPREAAQHRARGLIVPDRVSPDRPRIDAAKATEALHLDLEPLGPAHFAVFGGDELHYVELDPYFDCDCGAFVWAPDERPVICKHLVRALAATHDAAAVAAIEMARAALPHPDDLVSHDQLTSADPAAHADHTDPITRPRRARANSETTRRSSRAARHAVVLDAPSIPDAPARSTVSAPSTEPLLRD